MLTTNKPSLEPHSPCLIRSTHSHAQAQHHWAKKAREQPSSKAAWKKHVRFIKVRVHTVGFQGSEVHGVLLGFCMVGFGVEGGMDEACALQQRGHIGLLIGCLIGRACGWAAGVAARCMGGGHIGLQVSKWLRCQTWRADGTHPPDASVCAKPGRAVWSRMMAVWRLSWQPGLGPNPEP